MPSIVDLRFDRADGRGAYTARGTETTRGTTRILPGWRRDGDVLTLKENSKITFDLSDAIIEHKRSFTVELAVSVSQNDRQRSMRLFTGTRAPVRMYVRRHRRGYRVYGSLHIRHRTGGTVKREWVELSGKSMLPYDEFRLVSLQFDGRFMSLCVNSEIEATRMVVGAQLVSPASARVRRDEIVIGGSNERSAFYGSIASFKILDKADKPPPDEPHMIAMESKYESLSESTKADLGPASEPIEPFKTGWKWEFPNGGIYYSEATGARLLMNDINNLYRARHEYLGLPLEDENPVPGRDEMTQARCENGILYDRPGRDWATLWGDVYACYTALRGGQGVLGYPVQIPAGPPSNPQRITVYEKGRIYRSSTSGPFEVHGPIMEKYLSLGGADGVLGYPLSHVTRIVDSNNNVIGQKSIFEGGSLIRRVSEQAFLLRGRILEAYLEIGGPTSDLGFPVSDMQEVPGSSARYCGFDNGVIWWSGNSSDDAIVLKEMSLVLKKVHQAEPHPGAPDESQLFVTGVIKAPIPGLQVPQIWPVAFQHGTDPEQVIINATYSFPLRHDTSFTIDLQIWDLDSWPDQNDLLGAYKRTFNAANSWGLSRPNGTYDNMKLTTKVGSTEYSTYRVSYQVKPKGEPVQITPSNFREKAWWKFGNFTTATLGGDVFRTAFGDVGQAALIEDPLKWIFYELFVKNLASEGNCFGMSAEAFHALKGGNSVFGQPLHTYGKTTAQFDIKCKHVYQVGCPVLEWTAQNIGNGMFVLPRQTYDAIAAEVAAHGACLVSMFNLKSMMGHAVLAYECIGPNADASYGTIRVADPHDPWSSGESPHTTSIHVNADNTWIGSSGYSQTTGSLAPGLLPVLLPETVLLYFPWHTISPIPCTPVWSLVNLVLSFFKGIFSLGGAARTVQMENNGAKMFEENTGGVFINGIPGCSLVPLAVTGKMPFLAVAREPLQGTVSLTFQGTANGNYSYSGMLRSSAHSIGGTIKNGEKDTVDIEEAQTLVPLVKVTTTEQQKRLTAEYVVPSDPGGQAYTRFSMNLQVSAGAHTWFKSHAVTGGIMIGSNAPAGQTTVEVSVFEKGQRCGGKILRVATPTNNEVIHVRPLNWPSPVGEAVIERLSGPDGDVLSSKVVEVKPE